MKKKALLAVPVILAACTAIWFAYFRTPKDPNHRIFVSGNIEATEVDLAFRISGQIKTLLIEEGTRLAKDQVIATLDTDTLYTQKGSAESEIGNCKAVLDELEEGTRIEEILQARATLKAAESKLKNAKDEFERYLALKKEGAVSASNFDLRDTTLKVAQEDLNNAAEKLRQLERGPREQQIRAAKARLSKAEFDLQRILLDIAHSTLSTPTSGVVLVKSNEIGEIVLPGATVATVAAIDEVWLKGYVGESNLGRIKLGQKALITTDTYPGKQYEGIITFISSRAEFTPKNVQTREERIKQVYRVKITIKNPLQELKIGMPAEGYIFTDSDTTNNADSQAKK